MLSGGSIVVEWKDTLLAGGWAAPVCQCDTTPLTYVTGYTTDSPLTINHVTIFISSSCTPELVITLSDTVVSGGSIVVEWKDALLVFSCYTTL